MSYYDDVYLAPIEPSNFEDMTVGELKVAIRNYRFYLEDPGYLGSLQGRVKVEQHLREVCRVLDWKMYQEEKDSTDEVDDGK